MLTVLGDVRFALRSLAQRPGFTAAVTGLVAVVALGAAWLPARRASRVDPAKALRAE